MTFGLQYPPADVADSPYYGAVPVDFMLESVLLDGLEWFRTDPEAKNFVFGWLAHPILAKYGQNKIDEIAAYINRYEVAVVQSFALIPKEVPSISLQLLDGGEQLERTGLNDFQRTLNTFDTNDDFAGRFEDGYSPIGDSVHLGIHTINTPDLAKYLYYLVIYVLSEKKLELEDAGLILGTFRATDLSRLNDYLPENMYSRFINFSVSSLMRFRKGSVPVLDTIRGVHVAGPGADPENVDLGLSIEDIQQSTNGGG